MPESLQSTADRAPVCTSEGKTSNFFYSPNDSNNLQTPKTNKIPLNQRFAKCKIIIIIPFFFFFFLSPLPSRESVRTRVPQLHQQQHQHHIAEKKLLLQPHLTSASLPIAANSLFVAPSQLSANTHTLTLLSSSLVDLNSSRFVGLWTTTRRLHTDRQREQS